MGSLFMKLGIVYCVLFLVFIFLLCAYPSFVTCLEPHSIETLMELLVGELVLVINRLVSFFLSLSYTFTRTFQRRALAGKCSS